MLAPATLQARSSWHSKLFYLSIVSMLVLQVLWMSKDKLPPFWDQAGYVIDALTAGKLIAEGGISGFFHAFHVNTSRPTLIIMITGLLNLAIHHITVASMLVNLLAMIALVFAVRQMGILLRSTMVGDLSAAMTAWMPAVVGFTREFLMDLAFGAMVTLALLFCFRTDGFTDRKASLFAGTLLGASFLVKSEVLFYLGAPIALYILWSTRCMARPLWRWKTLLFFSILASAVLVLCGTPALPRVLHRAGMELPPPWLIHVFPEGTLRFVEQLVNDLVLVKSAISLNLLMAFLFTLTCADVFVPRRHRNMAPILIVVSGTLVMTDIMGGWTFSPSFFLFIGCLVLAVYAGFGLLVRALVDRAGNIFLYCWTAILVAGTWTFPNIKFVHGRYLTIEERVTHMFDLAGPWYAWHELVRYPVEIPSEGTTLLVFVLGLVGMALLLHGKSDKGVRWYVVLAWSVLPLVPLTRARSVGAVIQATLPFIGGYALFAALAVERLWGTKPRVALSAFATTFLLQVYVVVAGSFAPWLLPSESVAFSVHSEQGNHMELALLKHRYRYLRKPISQGAAQWGIRGTVEALHRAMPAGRVLVLSDCEIIHANAFQLEARLQGLTEYEFTHRFWITEDELLNELCQYDAWVIKTRHDSAVQKSAAVSELHAYYMHRTQEALKETNAPSVAVGQKVLIDGHPCRGGTRILFSHHVPDGEMLYLILPEEPGTAG